MSDQSSRRATIAAALCLAVLPAAALAQRSKPVASAAPAVDSTLYGALHYRMIGPFRGGRSTAVTGVPGQPHVFFAGGTGGGIWKTDDAGTTWRNITDGFFGGGIGAIAVAPSDPNVIFVGTGSACIRGNVSQGRGAWKSTDGGRNWSFIGLANAGQIGAIEVHPSDPDLVYAAVLGHPFGKSADRGVYRSKDGGKSWQKVLYLNDSTGAATIAMNPRNPRILYAGMWRAERKPWSMISGGAEGGVYRSTDGGDTWKKLAGGLPTGIVGKVGVTVSRANPDRVWALIEAEPEGGLYRSDDGGDTWTRTNRENKLRQRAFYYTHVFADPADENTVYALNTSIYRSIDAGKTFEPLRVPHGDTHDLWINPGDPRLMILADDGGAQVSLTHGESWSSMNAMPTAEFYDVVTDNQFPYRVYSSQQDNTSISVPAWSGPNSLHPIDLWRYAAGCETGPVALNADHPDLIYGGCYGGAINRFDVDEDDRRDVVAYPQLALGEAPKDLRYRFQWVAPILVSQHDPNVVYHGSQYVLRSRDRGMTWERISPDLTTNDKSTQGYPGGPINHDGTGVEVFNTIFSLAEDPHDANILWAGSDDGKVHVTRDGGQNWADVTPPGMPKFATVHGIDVSVHASGRAWVAAQRYRLDDFKPYIWRTDDWGRSWTLLTDGTNGIPADWPVRSVREDPVREGLLYAGTEYGIFVSFDAGAHWRSLQLNLPITPVMDLQVHGSDLVVATQGRALWVLDDVTPLRQLADVSPSATAHLFAPRDTYRVQVGPGGAAGGVEHAPDELPAGSIIQYWLATDVTTPVTLEVLDESDRVVRRFSSDSAAAKDDGTAVLSAKRGAHRAVWDLFYPGPRPAKGAVIWGYLGGVKAPPGTYRVRLAAAGTTETRELHLLADPRLKDVTQADYDEQFRVSMRVRDTLDAVYRAIETVRSVRDQAAATVKAAASIGQKDAIAPLADAMDGKLHGVEDSLVQSRSESNQDPIRFPGRLDNQLAELYGNLTGVDSYIHGGAEGRPTAGATERVGDLEKEWSPIRAGLQQIIDKDVAAFNAQAKTLGLGPIVLPRPKPIM